MATAKRWRKPTDRELKAEYEAWCDGPGPEEARRHLYEMGFQEGTARERERGAKAAKPRRRKTGEPCGHPSHRNPGLLTPCPQCGERRDS